MLYDWMEEPILTSQTQTKKSNCNSHKSHQTRTRTDQNSHNSMKKKKKKSCKSLAVFRGKKNKIKRRRISIPSCSVVPLSARYRFSAESRTTDSTVWIQRGGASAWTLLPFLSTLPDLQAQFKDREEG